MLNYLKAAFTWLLYNKISSIGKTDQATDKKNAELIKSRTNKKAFAQFNNKMRKMEFTYYEGDPATVDKAYLSFADMLKKLTADPIK